MNGTATSESQNDVNELTAKGGSSLTYDNNGDILTDDAGNTYTYDAWNRVVSENQNDQPATFDYSTDGRDVTTTAICSGSSRQVSYYDTSWREVKTEYFTFSDKRYEFNKVRYVW